MGILEGKVPYENFEVFEAQSTKNVDIPECELNLSLKHTTDW